MRYAVPAKAGTQGKRRAMVVLSLIEGASDATSCTPKSLGQPHILPRTALLLRGDGGERLTREGARDRRDGGGAPHEVGTGVAAEYGERQPRGPGHVPGGHAGVEQHERVPGAEAEAPPRDAMALVAAARAAGGGGVPGGTRRACRSSRLPVPALKSACPACGKVSRWLQICLSPSTRRRLIS